MSDDDEKHLFMLCRALNRSALSALPAGLHIRLCRQDDLDHWMAMPFDTKADADAYRGFMQAFFDRVYAARAGEFFARCTFICDARDVPVATVFTWPIRLGITTIHWLKVDRAHEGKGLGRAIMSHVMTQVAESDYPILLHTHPTSHRAVKLYADFGFALLSDPLIGSRPNHLMECLSHLRLVMPPGVFDRIPITQAPRTLLDTLRDESEPEF